MNTPDILKKIVDKKSEKLIIDKEKYSIDNLIRKIELSERPKSFYEAIKKDGLSIIGEVKKASPSKGVIIEDFNYMDIALEYEKCVDAISVLTEEDFFLGNPEYLLRIHKNINTPLLRKDFIIDEFQIYEARYLGASAILLICSILSKEMLKDYIKLAKEIGLDALVEVHDHHDLEKALYANAKIIGVNNRNLRDFSVSLETTISLSKQIPKDNLVVSESGIATYKDVEVIKEAGIDGILVGESFMRTNNFKSKVKEFKEAYEDKN